LGGSSRRRLWRHHQGHGHHHGLGGNELNTARMKPDALGEALRLTRQQNPERPNNMDFHRFD